MSRLVVIAGSEPERADRIREACTGRGYETRVVATGADALEVAVAEAPDALVGVGRLDLIGGDKLLEILRTNPRTRRIRFVFVGGDEGGGEEWGVEKLGTDASAEDVGERIAELVTRGHRLDAAVRETREQVEGRLSQIPLVDLLQLFHLNRRTGTIELRRRTNGGRSERGRVHLRDGDVIQAVTGPVEGEKALFRLLTWADGSFAFRTESVPGVETRIAATTRGLLMEGVRQLDEWRRLRTELPSLDAHVALKVPTADLPSVVHPLTQEVLLLLELYSQVAELVDHASFPDYQVLRTLQTLIDRGIVELRAAPATLKAEAGLFRTAQVRRLREWVCGPGGDAQPSRDAKLLIAAADPQATRDFLSVLQGLPGLRPAAEIEDGVAEDRLTPVARLQLGDEVGIEFVHVPTDPSFAPLWPLAGYGALGTLCLMSGSVKDANARLRPFFEALDACPRSRLIHLLMLRQGEAGLVDEIHRNVGLVEESELFLMPLESDKAAADLLRAPFAKLLP